MIRPQLSRRLSLVLIVPANLILALSLAAQCTTNDPGITTVQPALPPPCFAGNSDILGGRTSLLQDDDLVVNTLTPPLLIFPPTIVGASLQTGNSTITTQTPTNIAFSDAKPFAPVTNVVTLSGRLFNLNHDQILSFAKTEPYTGGQQSPTVAIEGTLDSSIPLPSSALLTAINNATTLYGVSGPLLGNGYDQMAVLGWNSQSQQLFIQALAGYDPLVPGDGIIAGALAGPIGDGSPVLAVTAGVFTDPSASNTRPAAQLAVLTQGNNSLVITFYAVDPLLTVSLTRQLTLSLPANVAPGASPIAISAGRFNAGTHDQLAVAYAVQGNNSADTVYITTVDFASGTPTQQTTTNSLLPLNTTTSPRYPAAVYLAKGKFNWFGNAEQLGISVGSDGANGAHIGVMSFDSSLNGTMGTALNLSSACHFALTAGRFDNQQPSGSGQPNPNLQLADVATNCGDPTQTTTPFNANIYNVDPTNFAVTAASVTSLTSTVGYGPDTGLGPQAVTLIAGDEQGRSLALGPPEEVTVAGHTQPDFVLQLPPMHVDWIPADGDTVPQILNVSVYPGSFNASLSSGTSSTTSLNRVATTSYTVATKETANEKVSYGVPALGAGVSVQASQAASETHQNTVATKYNTFGGYNQNYVMTTTFDDVVGDTTNQLNIFSYPVVGQCDTGAVTNGSCPNGGSPLYIQFSGPDNVQYVDLQNGGSAEWYQPVQEPGNIFSYPATVSQFQSNIAGGTAFTPLTNPSDTWDVNATSAFTANWTSQNGQSVSSGSVQTHTFDASVSTSGSIGFDGFGASASGSFDYSDSSSLSTLNQTTSSFGSSTGITLARGLTGSSLEPGTYDYQGGSFIYGQTPPAGTPNTGAPSPTPAPTLQTQGFIAVGHTVDMMSAGAVTSGPFWRNNYTSYPDVALNHPLRWLQKKSETLGQEVQFNCPYGFSSAMSSPPTPCATITPQQTAAQTIAGADFYWMKGLFVTPGGTFNGPTITSTTLGSTVNLRIRIYNYSLYNSANYPAGATLHVQFYAQPWDGEHSWFATTDSTYQTFQPAVFIGNGTTESGDTSLTVPPSFCGGAPADGSDPCAGSGASTNNWEYVYASWDTSKGAVTANSFYKFWVVTWLTDGDGKLIAETPGHGLTSLPQATPYNSLADVPIETYSNNLGFYNQMFSILPATTGVSTSPTSSNGLSLGKIDTLDSKSIVRDVPVTVFAPHITSGGSIDSVFTEYYDGNPAKGGTLFDTQFTSRVFAGGTFVDSAHYRAQTCGLHEIFVRAIPIGGAVATSSKRFRVTSDPVAAIDELITFVKSPAYPKPTRAAMLVYLTFARRAFQANRRAEGAAAMKLLRRLLDNEVFHLRKEVREPIIKSIDELLRCL